MDQQATGRPKRRDVLIGGETLGEEETLESQNGVYTLTYAGLMLTLVEEGSTTVWTSTSVPAREREKDGTCLLQLDGNWVIRDKRGKVIWETATTAAGGSYAVMQNDGNLCVYGGIVWCRIR